MSDRDRVEWTPWERTIREAMRAELDWAPLRFEGWGHYEQARPLLPNETIEVIGRWPNHGYTLQYRPMLSELTESRQTPVDFQPDVTVLGKIRPDRVASLRDMAASGNLSLLEELALKLAEHDRTIPIEPPVRTGSSIPGHDEIDVHYEPAEGVWLSNGGLIHEHHPSAAYGVAGYWDIRLGPPVGATPTGLLVFQPPGHDGVRLTVEHPTQPPAGVHLDQARIGIYRYVGLGRWEQTAMVRRPDEIARLVSSPALDRDREISQLPTGHVRLGLSSQGPT